MLAEFNRKIRVERSICQLSECSLTFVERLSFEASDRVKQPYRFAESVFGAQKKAIAALVGVLLEEALKHHVGVLQLGNVVGPLYLRNKQ